MNGYFRLVKVEQGIGLELIPPTDGGEQIRIAEVMDYLSNYSLVCDLSVLKEKISTREKETIFLKERVSEFSVLREEKIIPFCISNRKCRLS